MSPTEKTPQPSSSGETITDRRALTEALSVAVGRRHASDDKAVMAAEHARVRRARIQFLEHALAQGLIVGPAALRDAEHTLDITRLQETEGQ